MYTGELCELHGWWINLDSTIQFPTKTKTTDEFMQITTRNELHCPFLFFCFLENLCRIENTSKSIFQHIRVPLNAWHTMRCANFIYRFSNASDKYTRTLAIVFHEYIMCVTRNILTFHWHCYKTQLSWLHW